MKKTLRIILIILLVLIGLFLGSFFYAKSQLNAVDPKDNSVEIFEIEPNSSAKTVFNKLKSEGFIKDNNIAYYYARFLHHPDFKAGKYEISKSMNIDSLIDYMSDGNNALQDTVIVKILEGEWLKYFAVALEENTNLDANDLMNYWNDESVVRNYMKDYEFLTEEIFNSDIRYKLEGYLFPDTYEFYQVTTNDEVTRKMLDRTNEVYQKYKDDFAKSDLSIHQIFTLASMLQFESGSYEDMTKISSVFRNRLAIGMPLQSSVTVCYAIDLDIKNESWQKCELASNAENPSPYNTYLFYGLPPGPIVSPGEDAIDVALHPAQTDYLYFMADVCNNTGVYFSETYAEQLMYYAQYLGCLQ